MKAFVYLSFVMFMCDGISCLFLPEFETGRLSSTAKLFPRVRRLTRPTHRVINPADDCVHITSDEGEVFVKSPSDEEFVCGIYMIADPDKRIQVTFNYLDIPCDKDGLVAWVDGWELSSQVWPADDWDDDRVLEFCDRRPQRKLVSRQNAALIQYRVAARGKAFAVTIRHLKNSKPCNVMLFGSEGVHTLRNHGSSGNCSIIAVAPTTVRILDLNVGQADKRGSSLEYETGKIHQCTKRGLADFVDIGGASGLDHTKMEVLDNVCGLDSTGGHRSSLIACEDTVVRLSSSGRYQNSVTVAFSALAPEDIEHADLICGLNDL